MVAILISIVILEQELLIQMELFRRTVHEASGRGLMKWTVSLLNIMIMKRHGHTIQ
ncbi:hypothetical protein IC620_15040 [Hazenella sp. IB182357]|uniref:Uncharacterized protein n=1 Tax=Polycladospora coralii TaxID=2771432 RepID=A0A926N7Z1_9BACL|nr:hypothetical protein [Polycladospora coralii]MBD1373661.1 hypothetical protein [Polycladospora coralii]